MLGPDRSPGAAMDALREQARAILPEDALRYYESGSGDGVSAAEAAAAWEALRLRPRALRDVSDVSTDVEVLGTPLRTPVLVAPSAAHRLAHPDGEVATAAGTARAGSLLVLSTRSTTRMDRVAAEGAPWWMQVYVLADRGISDEVARGAAAHGARALVLTGDTPFPAHKPSAPVPALPGERVLPLLEERDEADLAQAADVTTADIARLREVSGLPVLVKGVLRADDARACVDAGAAGVVVSNHGGRQLDGAVPTAWALPEVAEALAGSSAEVYVDGGIRRGRDVLAALALGARAVLVGRPVLWALAVGGADAVAALLDRLTGDTAEALAVAGCARTSDPAPDLVWHPDRLGRTVRPTVGVPSWPQ